jgi:hypothetical protein
MRRESPNVAVICSNLNPSTRMARSLRASTVPGARPDLPEAVFGASPVRSGTKVFDSPEKPSMFDFQDLFQWDRFITPTIIKTFYWLVIGLIVLFGLSGIFSALAAMAISPFGGFILLLSSIAGVIVGVVFSRIAAEFILIVFRINEHLGAIRDQGGMR